MLLPKPRPKLLDKRDAAKQTLREWQKVRRAVFVRDKQTCRVCRQRAAYDAHHLLARSRGGTATPDNLIAVCRRCHEDIHGHVVRLRWRDDSNRAGTLRIERVA